jgi:hypothetical protein
MCDDIRIECDDFYKRIFVRNLIAFLPEDGYIIFEGYSYIKKEDLPCKIKCNRYQMKCNMTEYFEAEVTEIYKKDLQPEPKEDTGHECEDDDCDCRYSFFSSDIIIFKINITRKEKDNAVSKLYPEINFAYCIDNRFKSMNELIDRYTNLVEVPEDTYEPYDIRESDKEFYIGLHNLMDKECDIFDSQYIEYYKTTKYKGMVNGAKKIPRAPDTSILPILEKWSKLYGNAHRGIGLNFGNKTFLKNTLEFFDYVEEQIPFLQKWCAEYVCDLPFQDKLRGWLTYGIKNGANIGKEPKDFEKFWKLFFRKEGNEEDVIMLNFTNFDVSYRHYLKLINDMEKEKDMNNCKVSRILNIHKDLPCDGDLCCFRCEEKENRWHAIVSNKYKSMNNIFINPKLGELFVEKWLEAVLKLEDNEQEKINFIWPPVRDYIIEVGYSENHYEYNQYISELIKERDRTYHGYVIRPKVEFEFIDDLRNSLNDFSISSIYPIREGPNQYNEIYLFLSHLLTYVSYILHIDRKRCNELVEIFSKLPDE